MKTIIKNILLIYNNANDVTLIKTALEDAHFGNWILLSRRTAKKLSIFCTKEENLQIMMAIFLFLFCPTSKCL